MYVGMHGLGMSLADCSGRRVHKIDPYMVTYYDCIRVDFMYMGVAWVCPCSGRRVDKIDPLVWWYACYYIRVDFIIIIIIVSMYVGVAWVCPWLIALEGEYIRLTPCMVVYMHATI